MNTDREAEALSSTRGVGARLPNGTHLPVKSQQLKSVIRNTGYQSPNTADCIGSNSRNGSSNGSGCCCCPLAAPSTCSHVKDSM